LQEGEVHVCLGHEPLADWACPECGHELCLPYDHDTERSWRHLDTCQYRTILHAAPPQIRCAEHGVRVVRLPWAEPHSCFTALFERLAIDWLKAASQKAVGDQLRLSWDEVHGIMERAVRRGLARRKAETIGYLGVDEKSFRKGHKYLTLVTDLARGRVLYVAADRKQSSLDGSHQFTHLPSYGLAAEQIQYLSNAIIESVAELRRGAARERTHLGAKCANASWIAPNRP